MTPDPNCEFCHGEGKVDVDEFDKDSGQWQRGVGCKKCICTLSEEKDDYGENE